MAVMIIQLVNIILSLTVRHEIAKIVRLAAAGIYVNNHLLNKAIASTLKCLRTSLVASEPDRRLTCVVLTLTA